MYIFNRPHLTARIYRWQALLAKHDIVYMSQEVMKGNALTDQLAKKPFDDYEPMKFKFPNEDIMMV